MNPQQASQILIEFFLKASLQGGTGQDFLKVHAAIQILTEAAIQAKEVKETKK